MLKFIKRSGRKITVPVLAAALALANASYFQTVDFSSVYVSAATGEYKTWRQGDPRWGSIRLGSSYETIKQSGCAVTSIAMLLVKSGNFDESTINPGSLCEFLSNNGGLDSSACIYWGTVSKLCPSFTFEGTGLLYGTTAEEKTAEIKSYADQGYYLIADVKYSGHWVAIDRIEDGVVYAIDPATGTTIVLFDQYNYKGSTRVKLFRSSDQPIIKAEPVQVPEKTYETGSYVTNDILNIREGASTASARIDVLGNNSDIMVEEVSGGWGKIFVNGITGWVCLNYASKTEDAPVIEAVAEVQKQKEYETGMYVTKDVINYRQSASVMAQSFGLLNEGISLAVSEISDNWGRTSYNGNDCWICLDYAERTGDIPAEAVKEPEVTEAVVTEAEVTETEATETEATETEATEAEVTEAQVTEAAETEASEEKITEAETTEAQVTEAEVTEQTDEVTVSEESGMEESDVVIAGVEYITTDYLNFRVAAGITNSIIDVIPANEIVTVKEIDGDWGKTEYKGETGWISLKYAKPVEENTEVQDMTASEDINAEETEAEDNNVTDEKTSDEEKNDIIPAEVALKPEDKKETVRFDSVYVTGRPSLEGDVNDDGTVNSLDIIELANIILKNKEVYDITSADINKDGRISISDFVVLKLLLLE